MGRPKQSCLSLANQLGVSPQVTLTIARLLGSSKPLTVADSVTAGLCAHIVELHSDPTRARQWNRLLQLATLSSSRQLGSRQARELAELARSLRYVSAEQAAREKLKVEAKKRKADAKAADRKRQSEARAAREVRRQSAAKRRSVPADAASQSTATQRRGSKSSDRDLPISKYDEYPEYLWREVPNGHPGSGRRR